MGWHRMVRKFKRKATWCTCNHRSVENETSGSHTLVAHGKFSTCHKYVCSFLTTPISTFRSEGHHSSKIPSCCTYNFPFVTCLYLQDRASRLNQVGAYCKVQTFTSRTRCLLVILFRQEHRIYRASTTSVNLCIPFVGFAHSQLLCNNVSDWWFSNFSLLFGQPQVCSGMFIQIKVTVSMHGRGNYLVVVSIPGSMKYKDLHNKAGFIGIWMHSKVFMKNRLQSAHTCTHTLALSPGFRRLGVS